MSGTVLAVVDTNPASLANSLVHNRYPFLNPNEPVLPNPIPFGFGLFSSGLSLALAQNDPDAAAEFTMQVSVFGMRVMSTSLSQEFIMRV